MEKRNFKNPDEWKENPDTQFSGKRNHRILKSWPKQGVARAWMVLIANRQFVQHPTHVIDFKRKYKNETPDFTQYDCTLQ